MTIETTVTVARYAVSCTSPESLGHSLPVLLVEWHSYWRRWVVTDGEGRVYDMSGKPAYPSSTATPVLGERFSYPDEVTALEVARRIAPSVSVAGKTVAATLAELGSGSTPEAGCSRVGRAMFCSLETGEL